MALKSKVQVKKWGSPSLGNSISMSIHGTGGTPVLAFPGFGGNHSEYKKKRLLDDLEEQLEKEFNIFYCVDTVDKEIFNQNSDNAHGRLVRYSQYENYILDEVIPFIRDHSGNDFLIAAGMGFGAYHALNLSLKHPGLLQKVLAACGQYDIRPYFNGFFSEDLYYNNPLEYFPNLNDENILGQIKKMDIRIITNSFDPYRSEAEKMSDFLNDKWIDHSLDLWETHEKCNNHDFSKMLRNHIP
jgi:esterase/lipase superfamily enzyme